MVEDWDDKYEYEGGPCTPAEEAEANRDIKAAALRTGDRATLRLLDLFWPGPADLARPEWAALSYADELTPPRPQIPLRASSNLTARDALRIYNGLSFAMWRYGPAGIVSAHITILWATMEVTDHQLVADLLSKFLSRAKKTFERDREVRLHPEISNLKAQAGFRLSYCYVHENDVHRGLHTHILATLPVQFRSVFDAWARRVLTQLTGRPCLPETIEVVAPGRTWSTPSVKRAWLWYRYVMKALPPEVTGPVVGPVPSLRQMLRVKAPYRRTPPVLCRKRTGVSQDIDVAAQGRPAFRAPVFPPALAYRAAQLPAPPLFHSALAAGEWDRFMMVMNLRNTGLGWTRPNHRAGSRRWQGN